MTDAGKARGGSDPGGKGHEPDRLSMPAVGVCIVVLLLLIVGVQPIVGRLLWAYRGPEDPAAELRLFDPGSARHWNDPAADLAALRKEEDHNLNEYGWIDRQEGVVQIPIERAMEILAAKGGDPSPESDVETDAQKTGGTAGESEQQR